MNSDFDRLEPANAETEPATSAPSGRYPSSRAGQVSLAAIGEAWGLFMANISAWVGATAIYLSIIGVLQLWASSRILAFNHGADGPIGAWTPYGVHIANLAGGEALIISPTCIVLTGMNLELALFLSSGLRCMALQTAKTGMANLADFWGFGAATFKICVAMLLTFVTIASGMLFCPIIGIYAMVGLSFTHLAILDTELGPVGAMRLSWNAVSGRWFSTAVFHLVFLLIGCTGLLLAGVGILVSVPLALIAQAVVYRDVCLSTLVPPEPAKAPIADPNR